MHNIATAPTRRPLTYALDAAPSNTREWQELLKDDIADLRRERRGLGVNATDNPAYDVLSELIMRREIQHDSAFFDNQIVQYTDDMPDNKQISTYVGTVGELGSTFRLPETSRPATNPAIAVGLLNSLPFVHMNDLPKASEAWRFPVMVVKGPLAVPLERVVSAECFDAWSGRGGNDRGIPDGEGYKGFHPQHFLDIEKTSRGAIVDYAQNDPSVFKDRYDLPIIDIVRDAAREYWSFATTDGMHRLAAAKLRGALISTVASVRIPSPVDMPQLSFAVRERFAYEHVA